MNDSDDYRTRMTLIRRICLQAGTDFILLRKIYG